jgi:FkbM family methyltransferase
MRGYMLLRSDKAKAYVRKFPPLRYAWKRLQNALYLRQKAISQTVEYHGFQFEIPSNHKLMILRDEQPNREEGLRIAAWKIFQKHPGKIYVDIGANIGDTAAVVRSVSSCAMVLVEPSDIFYPYLCRNALRFGHNVSTIQGFFVSPNDFNAEFELLHWEGTARPRYKGTRASPKQQNFVLDQLSRSPIGLMKIDTDGYDLNLIDGYMDHLAYSNVNLYFELEVRSQQDVIDWRECISKLLSKGYAGILLWDDPGHFMCSVTSVELAHQLLNWQLSYMNENHKGIRRIFNFDVLAISHSDRDIFGEIEEVTREAVTAS